MDRDDDKIKREVSEICVQGRFVRLAPICKRTIALIQMLPIRTTRRNIISIIGYAIVLLVPHGGTVLAGTFLFSRGAASRCR